MKILKKAVAGLMLSAFMIALPTLGFTGVEKVIDKTNWQEIEGLVADKVLEWVKNGELIMNVGTLDFSLKENEWQWVRESRVENVGKYDLDENIVIVDAKTGEAPRYVKGFPFPEIDAQDPKAGEKIMQNGSSARNNVRGLRSEKYEVYFIARSGLERRVDANFYFKAYDGYPGAESLPNPNNLELQSQVIVTHPFDMAGTAMMTWRYRSAQPDMLFAFVPAIRRVRRVTPAGRSDPMFGSDFARDDGGWPMFDNKISTFEWKVIGKKEMLHPFLQTKPLRMLQTKDGEMKIEFPPNLVQWSWEKDEAQRKGAPWFNTNAVWVKRQVWIIEGRPKDPYYNYGRTINYVDTESFGCACKEIWDRSDEFWKVAWSGWLAAKTDDGKFAYNINSDFFIYDSRDDHATIIDLNYDLGEHLAKLPADQFSLSGFTQFSK